MNDKCVIITGATGFIGTGLLSYFHLKGWKVIAFVHHIPDQKLMGIEYVRYRLEEEPADAYFAGVTHLIHCAYIRYHKGLESDKMNLNGTQMLIEKCRKHNVKILYYSSFSAHEEAESHYGRTKLRSEKLFDLTKDIIMKPGLVLGEGGLFQEMKKRIKRAVFFSLAGGGKQPLQTILLNDLIRATGKALDGNKNGLFLIAEPEPVTMKEFNKEIARQMKKNITFIPVPIGFLMMVCKLAEALKIKLSVSSENVLGLKQLRSFNTKNDLERLGLNIHNYKDSIKLLVGKK
jgi:nucleoside-diphosphate-sugar epimerase